MFDLVIDFSNGKPRRIETNRTTREMAKILLDLSEEYALLFDMLDNQTIVGCRLWFTAMPRKEIEKK